MALRTPGVEGVGGASGPHTQCEYVRRRYHLHLPGLVYGLTTLFLAVGAINSQNNLLFWAFGLAVAGLIVSGVLSGASLMGVRIAREPIAPAFAEGDLVIRYRVTNTNRFFPAFALNISELAAPARRRLAPPTWMKYVAPPFAFVAKLGPGETVVARSVTRATTRGQPVFDAVAVWTVFPFGLAKKSVTFSARRAALVRPAPIPVGAPREHGADRHDGADTPPGRSAHGEEFFAVREYIPGDTLRAVAWRASARLGQTVVRQFSARRAARLWVVPELPEHDLAEGERVIGRCAGLIIEASRAGKAVGLVVPGQGIRAQPFTGRVHAEQLLDALATISGLRPAGPPEDPRASRPQSTDQVVLVGTGARAPAPEQPP